MMGTGPNLEPQGDTTNEWMGVPSAGAGAGQVKPISTRIVSSGMTVPLSHALRRSARQGGGGTRRP